MPEPSEVEVVFRKLRGGKAPGIDLIDYAIWKALYNSFPNLLFRFFNLCIQFNHFPSIFKNTKIKFLLKPGRDPSSTLSYRPICLLSTLDKILERIFLNRFLRWISKNNILHRSQFGFRENRSCIEAVDKLVHHIKNTRVNKHTASTFIDIKSAFDNVDWSTLFYIFHSYRIPLHFQKFIHSYLTNRVIIWTDNTFTIKKQIFKGCPQGSVLSPTLWNIYFNPILSLNSELFLLQAFVDDLAVVSFGLSRRELEDNTNKILSLVNSKLSEINLSIATAKTVSVVFRCPFLQCRGFRGSTTFRRNPIFKIGSNSIHISKSYKYLGVNIDNRLSWTPHINSIKDKILWISSNFYRVSKNFNHQHNSLMKLWYTSVVQPIISYGTGVWGGSLTSIQGSCDRANLYSFFPSDKPITTWKWPTDMELELAESQRNATRTPSPQLTPCEQLKYSKAQLAKVETFRRCKQACVDALMMMPDHHPDEPFYVRAVTELQDIEEAMTLAIVLENTVNDELNLSQNKFELPQGAHFNNLEDSGPVENENNPNGSKNSASQNAPQTQLPPPIMLFVEKNYKAQMAAITKAFPKIRSRLTGEFLKLYTDSAEERRMAVQHLTMLDFQFYTIKSKAERPIKVVIKGLPRNTNPEEIKQDLEILGYTPDRVNQLIGRKNKRPLPIFLITLPRNLDNLKIFYLKTINYLSIRQS
ncbi:putative 115 kDa protein in type-1 retrotransposable element R1DM [Trichonephila clavipes]|uniref:Putative 115 kDa protein in type-1 retrotransposable element R1DM n=1 Tax=Trichonephila clavipes TaxID=2585209 RepID=A0A8X6WFD0_TRICX|nr:putative 115 kDa protein in type-1 retrotransposable element R1DM [Trichonephila clavipes]